MYGRASTVPPPPAGTSYYAQDFGPSSSSSSATRGDWNETRTQQHRNNDESSMRETATTSHTADEICKDGIAGFEKLEQVGQGTYGAVFKARHKKTRILVALKKLRLGEGDVCKDGLPKSVVREIRILSQLANGPNIVRLYGLCSSAATAHNRN
ncbi:hypothetical protein FOZ62_008854, partial [Perkinsus olseni]